MKTSKDLQYQAMTDSYVPDFSSDTPALGSHKALSDLIQTIKDNRNVPRKNIMQQLHGTSSAGSSSEGLAADQSRALNIASSVLCLMDWRSGEDLEALADDIIPLPFWQDSASITEFVRETFPERVHPLFESVSSRRRTVSNLNVRRLEKAGLHIEATTDVRRHLELDVRERVVRMYDCTPVLKEVLMTSQIDTGTLVIPRGLVVEILETIYEVLFPPDRDSRALLRRYVAKQGLDEDVLRYEVARFRSKDDYEIKFKYFGTRLADIYEELQNPTPRTALEA
ncbi:hypothetical protein E8E11_004320 [Didymella keratinophila]|nr:hypothetical protein E8E11_004320 [Didymella keratinophila]